ncbi:MAG TPA: hypothetical protein VHK70_06485 [Burkholderiaceae bacterium]|nr:hypothetical protein [Burkholderiaceae bacterium]
MKVSQALVIPLFLIAGVTYAQTSSSEAPSSETSESGITISTDPERAAAVEKKALEIQARQQSEGATGTDASTESESATTQAKSEKYAKSKSKKKRAAKKSGKSTKAGMEGSGTAGGSSGAGGTGAESTPGSSGANAGSMGTGSSDATAPANGK